MKISYVIKYLILSLLVILLSIPLLKCDIREKVATPTFSPGYDFYFSDIEVTISCDTIDAEIYYSFDYYPIPGSSDTFLYTGPISISSPVRVLSARAYKDGMIPSETAGTAYKIIQYDELVDVPSGQFDGQGFTHNISAFSIAKHELNYEIWYEVMEWAIENGYSFSTAGREGHDGKTGGTPSRITYEPVTTISWRDAIVWCNAYSELSGYTPCYTYNGNVIRDSRDSNSAVCDNADCNWSANGYRLPTEGEWQYAASYIDGVSWLPKDYASGATNDYTDTDATGEVSWYRKNAGGGLSGDTDNEDYGTHPVGTKNANALGIYDMSGNVWEWCWDWYGTYPIDVQYDYRGAVSGSGRVRRGGSWNFNADSLQVEHRFSGNPSYKYYSAGIRLVRIP